MDRIERIVRASTVITEFQRRVYLELLKVPAGETVSYGELGRRVGCRSAQAIGQALRRNPFAVGMPILAGGVTSVPEEAGIDVQANAGLDAPEEALSGGTPVFSTDFCVPCHRVVARDGSLCGFSGHRDGPELERKRVLLEREAKMLPERERKRALLKLEQERALLK